MRHPVRLAVAVAVAASLTGGALSVAAGSAVAAPSRLADDFNGDGFRDLAVGMPEQTVNGKRGAGAVLVTFGSVRGLTSQRVLVTQNSTGVPGAAEVDDHFASSLASGDVNRDGYADLLVGSEGEGVAGASLGGAVTVLWGGPSPLRSGLLLPSGPSYPSRMFGADIAVGDFTGDSAPDVAVTTATSLKLYSGTFTRTTAPAGYEVPRGDGGGWHITAGDFDGEGKDELAVVQQDVTIVHGQTPGTSSPASFGEQTRLAGGNAVAAGDLNGDGRADLAIGLSDPRLHPNGRPDPSGGSGYVTVHFGTASGLNPVRRVYHQNTGGVPGGNERGDNFGAALAIGDINGDHRADLAIGIPYESLTDGVRAGDVVVLRGASGGLTTTGAAHYTQDSPGVPGVNENNDVFGSQVRLADFSRDGKADLAVTAPYEDAGSGALWQLRGTTSGLSTRGVSLFGPREYGIAAGSGIGTTLLD
ncbi:FG-GAP-like repeat-containing protein [Streptomyces sp. NPDC093094]|uniref:FG-GAP-like repeat-containing protein n=1 Tax=Streptomyces sp. NPDC093094 TaxID=3366026 RepID=UPI0037F4FF26